MDLLWSTGASRQSLGGGTLEERDTCWAVLLIGHCSSGVMGGFWIYPPAVWSLIVSGQVSQPVCLPGLGPNH